MTIDHNSIKRRRQDTYNMWPIVTKQTRQNCAPNRKLSVDSLPSHQHRNRLKAMSPRSSMRHQFYHGKNESSSSDGGFACDSSEEFVRKYLFAPPVVVQNEIFRKSTTAMSDHSRHWSTYQRRHDLQGSGTCNGLVRCTGNDKYCGLSAEIALEIADCRRSARRHYMG